MDAANFFLGNALNDEAYSALESLFTFINFKTYQIYHGYSNRYRFRPYADNWEMIGIVPTTCSTVDVDYDGYDICSHMEDNDVRSMGHGRRRYPSEKYRPEYDDSRYHDDQRHDQYDRNPVQDGYNEHRVARPVNYGPPDDFQLDMRPGLDAR